MLSYRKTENNVCNKKTNKTLKSQNQKLKISILMWDKESKTICMIENYMKKNPCHHENKIQNHR